MLPILKVTASTLSNDTPYLNADPTDTWQTISADRYTHFRCLYMGPMEREALNLLQTHTVGSAKDWVVVEGVDKEPTIQEYTAFRERMLPLMPKISQNGVLKPAKPREGQVRR